VRVVLDFDLVSDFIFVIVLLYSVKLVEQELWQKEKGLIGVLPVRDSEAGAVGSLLSPGVGSDSGEGSSKAGVSPGETSKQDTKNGKEPIHWHSKCVTSVSLLI